MRFTEGLNNVSNLTRSEQVMAEKTICVLLVRGESPDGQKIYAYLGIQARRLEDFMEAQKKGTFQPEEYGTILASGIGEPDEETRKKMTEEYGFNHEAMIDIPHGVNMNDFTKDVVRGEKMPIITGDKDED